MKFPLEKTTLVHLTVFATLHYIDIRNFDFHVHCYATTFQKRSERFCFDSLTGRDRKPTVWGERYAAGQDGPDALRGQERNG